MNYAETQDALVVAERGFLQAAFIPQSLLAL